MSAESSPASRTVFLSDGSHDAAAVRRLCEVLFYRGGGGTGRETRATRKAGEAHAAAGAAGGVALNERGCWRERRGPWRNFAGGREKPGTSRGASAPARNPGARAEAPRFARRRRLVPGRRPGSSGFSGGRKPACARAMRPSLCFPPASLPHRRYGPAPLGPRAAARPVARESAVVGRVRVEFLPPPPAAREPAYAQAPVSDRARRARSDREAGPQGETARSVARRAVRAVEAGQRVG